MPARLSLGDQQTLDRVCDAFESSWREQARPEIAEVMASVPNHLQPLVLEELVRLDRDFRLARGEEPQPEDYLLRFPDATSVIRQVFSESPSSIAGDTNRVAADSSRGDHAPRELNAPRPSNGEEIITSSTLMVVRTHAQGGLGRVALARDGQLGREVAFKEIRPEFADLAHARARFVREAEITGRLQHPGIVPVYGVGSYADGRPFYAMKFIQGTTLRDAIKSHHQASSRRSEARLRLTQLLKRFIDVCNAVGYAHSQGIIHRDLKPANIMLGEYGETLVVDWGLAKQVGDAEELTRSQQWEHIPLAEADATASGSAIGTPQYMSPEQAAGKLQELGPATDIYALGATLFAIATGQAPIKKSSLQEMLAKAIAGDLRNARDIESRVPRALEAICRKAMASQQQHRYATAEQLAADVERFLADERVAAHTEGPLAKASRWARRHKTFVRAGVVALLLIATTAVVFGLTAHQLRNRAEDAERDTSRALRLKSQALEQEEEARRLSEEVSNRFMDAFRVADPLQGGDRDIRVLQMLDGFAEELLADDSIDPLLRASLCVTVEETLTNIAETGKSLPLAQLALRLRKEHLGDRHADTLYAAKRALFAEKKAGPTDDFGERLTAARSLSLEVLGERDELTLSLQRLDLSHRLEGEDREGAFEELVQLEARSRELFGDASENAQELTGLLGAELYNAQRYTEAERAFKRVLNSRKKRLSDTHPDTVRASQDLARTYFAQGRDEDALELFKKNYEQTKANLGEDHAWTVQMLHQYGIGLYGADRPEDALPLLQLALSKRQALFPATNDDVIASTMLVGEVLCELRQYQLGLPLLERAVESSRLAYGGADRRTETNAATLQAALAKAGRSEDAIAQAQRVLDDCRQKLGEDHPVTQSAVRNAGQSFFKARRYQQAIPLLQQAIADQQSSVEGPTEVSLELRDNLASCFYNTNQFAQAEPLLQALIVDRKAFHPLNAATSNSLMKLGCTLAKLNRNADAEPVLLEALNLMDVIATPEEPLLANRRRTLEFLMLATMRQQKFNALPPRAQQLADISDAMAEDLREGSLELANHLFDTGAIMIFFDQAELAERYFRETTRVQASSQDPIFFAYSQGMMATAMSQQGKFAYAEPLLLGAYQQLFNSAQENGWPSRTAELVADLANRIDELYARWPARASYFSRWRALVQNPQGLPPDPSQERVRRVK